MTSSPQDSTLLGESSLPDGPARTSAWRAFASDWLAHVRASSGRAFASSAAFSPRGSSWRTSPVPCPPPAPARAGGSVAPEPVQLDLISSLEELADDDEPEAGSPDQDGAWHST